MPRGRRPTTCQCSLPDGHDTAKTYASRWAYRRHLCLVHGYELVSCQTAHGVRYDDLRPLQGARLWQLREMYRRGQRHRSRAVVAVTAASPSPCVAVVHTSAAASMCSELEADLSPAQLTLTDELNSRRTLRQHTSTVETDEDLAEIYGADVGFLNNVLPDLFSPLLNTPTQDSNNNYLCASVTSTTSEISVTRGDVMYTVVPTCMPIINVESTPVSSVATASLSTTIRGATTYSVGVQADAASGDWRIRFNPSLASEILYHYLHADPFASASTLTIRTMRALSLHPTDWVSFDIIEAIAVGSVESDRLSARNQLSLLVPCINNPAMGMFSLTADIQRRLARPRESGGTQFPAEVIPAAALPEPIIIIDANEDA